jgi:hypothetical protein
VDFKPKKHTAETAAIRVVTLRELARDHTEVALKTIVDIMNNETEPGTTRIMAAQMILDRAWGKPAQQIRTEAIHGTYQDFLHLLQARDKYINKDEKSITIYDVIDAESKVPQIEDRAHE